MTLEYLNGNSNIVIEIMDLFVTNTKIITLFVKLQKCRDLDIIFLE